MIFHRNPGSQWQNGSPFLWLMTCCLFNTKASLEHIIVTSQWCDGVSNRLFAQPFVHAQIKKTLKLHVPRHCEGNPQVTGGFPSQRANNTENVSIWWRHHECWLIINFTSWNKLHWNFYPNNVIIFFRQYAFKYHTSSASVIKEIAFRFLISKLRVTGLCEGKPPVTSGFPSQRAINVENVSIWWRHYECWIIINFTSWNRIHWFFYHNKVQIFLRQCAFK